MKVFDFPVVFLLESRFLPGDILMYPHVCLGFLLNKIASEGRDSSAVILEVTNKIADEG
jgi:hypothetical protein